MNLVEGEENILAWLVQAGFQPGDLRAEIQVTYLDRAESKCPMAWACQNGQLNVCRWLFEMGAARDICRASNKGTTPMFVACVEGHLSVCQWLLEVGAAEDIRKADNTGTTPMLAACFKGHLPVCEWLFKMGAAEDIRIAVNGYCTPMLVACQEGKLPVCEWLFKLGAAEDIRKENRHGRTPMSLACENGHLSVCRWLFEVGAAEDIRKVDNNGRTPMFVASVKGHLLVCRWLLEVGAGADVRQADKHGCPLFVHVAVFNGRDLSVLKFLILNGALNHSEAEDHISLKKVSQPGLEMHRPALFDWAQKLLSAHTLFVDVVLPASVVLQGRRARQRLRSSPRRRCYLSFLPLTVLEILRTFLGVEKGRALRNVRDLCVCLAPDTRLH